MLRLYWEMLNAGLDKGILLKDKALGIGYVQPSIGLEIRELEIGKCETGRNRT